MAENVKKAVAEGLKEFYQTQLKPKFDMIEFKLLEHDQKFTAILEKQADHDEKFRDILGHFDQLYQCLARLEDEYQAIVQGLRRIEAMLESEQTRREVLERRVEELKRQVNELQLKIADLEQRIR